MKNTCIAIGGVPGTGKSTLVKNFLMDRVTGKVDKPRKTLDGIVSGDTFVVGKYSPYYDTDVTFPGTDRLSMSVQPEFITFSKETELNILFEGDRLFTASCLESLEETFEDRLKIIILTASQDYLEERYKKRGSDQSSKFLMGRRTKVNNISSNFSLTDNISFIDTDNKTSDHVYQEFMELIKDFTLSE